MVGVGPIQPLNLEWPDPLLPPDPATEGLSRAVSPSWMACFPHLHGLRYPGYQPHPVRCIAVTLSWAVSLALFSGLVGCHYLAPLLV